MALPLTKSAIEALGKRLVKCLPPASDDIELLQELLLAYDEALAVAVDLVCDRLGNEPTSRIKTIGTILDKLRRHGGSILKGMHDLAGMRIVSDCNRQEQDRLAEDLVHLFAKYGNHSPRLVDRRKHPSYGYRAVHIIVHMDGAAVEIQLRTKLQHEWADLFEKLADRIGRGIRYGEPPEHWRDKSVRTNPSEGRRTEKEVELIEEAYRALYQHRETVVVYAHVLADVIDVYERGALRLAPHELTELNVSIADGFADVRSAIDVMEPWRPPTSS